MTLNLRTPVGPPVRERELATLDDVRAVELTPGPPGENGSPGTGGTPGPPGTDGVDGADGVDGRTVLSGAGAPAGGLGVDGDFYIDTAADAIYGPKTAGAWGSGTSLVGPAGADGIDGIDGADGVDGTDGADGADGAPGMTILAGQDEGPSRDATALNAEASLLDATLTFPGDGLWVPGSVCVIEAGGTFVQNTGGSRTVTPKPKFAAETLCTSTAALTSVATTGHWTWRVVGRVEAAADINWSSHWTCHRGGGIFTVIETYRSTTAFTSDVAVDLRMLTAVGTAATMTAQLMYATLARCVP